MLSASGKLCVKTDSKVEGCFSACVRSKTVHRLKLQVSKNKTLLTYDLKSDGSYEVFPLQFGDGRYEIALYENISGNKYMKNGTIYLFIKMRDKNAPFLHANQYVNYSQDSDIVAKAKELCFGKSEKNAYESVCRYIKTSFTYDFIKAATVKAGVLPNLEKTFATHMGICQDLAAMTVAMLRSQGIVSKLVIGRADRQYHAWVESIIDGHEIRFDPVSQAKKYTTERFY